MKIAIVHDWFNDIGGAEKVVREMLVCYPEADVFSLIDFYDSNKRENYLFNKKVHTTFLQYIPLAKKIYRLFFPIFPYAIERLKLDDYDLIISSSSCVAKGIKKRKNQLHICYCHSPVRYAWDLRADYLAAINNKVVRSVFNYFLNRLQKWDLKNNVGVDHFIANSENVKLRIKNNYNRESVVIYPPVNIDLFSVNEVKEDYYFTVSRLVAYKKTELIIKAFANFPHLTLLVAGDGPNKKKLINISTNNVKILGYLSSDVLSKKISKAKAFVANANEDFGITIVEAQAAGTPIIVPFIGGYKETVNELTGLFFESQTVEDITNAIFQFESNKKLFNKMDFIQNTKRFDKVRFHREFKEFVDDKVLSYKTKNG